MSFRVMLIVKLIWGLQATIIDVLSCRVLENESRNEILILQPHLMNNLKDKFEEEVAQKKDYKTPGTPDRRSIG
jgi:hypothetical protein